MRTAPLAARRRLRLHGEPSYLNRATTAPACRMPRCRTRSWRNWLSSVLNASRACSTSTILTPADWRRRYGWLRAATTAAESPTTTRPLLTAWRCHAAWFRRVVEAIAPIRSDDGSYDAGRTANSSSSARSMRRQQTLTTTGGLLPLLRDDFAYFAGAERPVRHRSASLRPRAAYARGGWRRLDAVGNGHGVFVVASCGDATTATSPAPPPRRPTAALGARSLLRTSAAPSSPRR